MSPWVAEFSVKISFILCYPAELKERTYSFHFLLILEKIPIFTKDKLVIIIGNVDSAQLLTSFLAEVMHGVLKLF
jgi:hypothetical protein